MSGQDIGTKVAMMEAGRILGEHSGPSDFSAEDLDEGYRFLQFGTEEYRKTPEKERGSHKENLLEALTMIESEAAWFVLRYFFNDQDIENMECSYRQSTFIHTLYPNRSMFPFFNQRETAITALADAKIIEYENYSDSSALEKTTS
jgi:hypothetical protein